MTQIVQMPLWLLILLVGFAAVTFASHFLIPSVRWFFRRRLEKAVARINERLERPIQPFKLARRHDMIQRLIYDPVISNAISEHAKEEGVPEAVAFERARRYAREIVPSFSASLYFGFAIWLARVLSQALYRVRLGHFEQDALRAVDPDATVVFVMNHRSNMDYVLVTYLAAERSALSYAVGEWARVWPLSRLIKAMGAYFIRRKSRDMLYRKVLAQYVRLATQAGVTQAVFPEGGLSLDGAVAPPRMGILKYIVEGQDLEARDVVFVPVALNYDRVLEDTILIQAAKAGERRFRAKISVLIWNTWVLIWRRLRGKYHRFGYAAVSFGAPLSLRDWQGDVEDLAVALMRRVSDVVPVLPVPLVATAVMGGARTRQEVTAQVCDLMAALPRAHVHIPRDDKSYAAEVGLRALIGRGALVESENGVITINAENTGLLAYYANSISHFIPDDDLDS